MYRWIVAAVAAALAVAPATAADSPAVAAIKAVGREGTGNEAAAAAWKQIVAAGPAGLFDALGGFAGASPAAANWLRAAVDGVAQAEAAAKRPLPADKLEAFAADRANDPAARRIAFELLIAAVPAAKAKLLPNMTDDTSLELRRDAIAFRLDAAKAGDRKEYEALFAAARHKDQIEKLAKLVTDAGGTANVTAQMGFVTRWWVAGPFDSTAGAGFAKPYAPEAGVDLKATYTGKAAATFGWKPLGTGDRYAKLDLNKQFAKHKDAATYAFAVVESPAAGPVEIRAGSPTSIVIFLNGQQLFARDEYHHGDDIDQHAAKGTLKAGRNELLVKVCQNNQTQQWAQAWSLQVRLCDATGGAVPFALASPTAAETPPPPAPEKEKK